MSHSVNPGWYQDPEAPPGHTRWWDGEQWTDHRATPAHQGPLRPSASRRAWTRFRALPNWAQYTAAGVAALLVMGAIAGGSGSKDSASPAPEAEVAAPAPAPQATPTPKPTAADRRTEAGRRFYLSLDNDAIKLDDAIRAMQDESPAIAQAGTRDTRTLVKRMQAKTQRGEKAMGRRSPGARALIAAAERSLGVSDPHALVQARVAAQDARMKFTGEFVGPNAK